MVEPTAVIASSASGQRGDESVERKLRQQPSDEGLGVSQAVVLETDADFSLSPGGRNAVGPNVRPGTPGAADGDLAQLDLGGDTQWGLVAGWRGADTGPAPVRAHRRLHDPVRKAGRSRERPWPNWPVAAPVRRPHQPRPCTQEDARSRLGAAPVRRGAHRTAIPAPGDSVGLPDRWRGVSEHPS